MFVFSNLAMSLDGKIGTKKREYFPLGSTLDRRRMIALRKKADAVLIGASTLRTYPKSLKAPLPGKNPLNILVSSGLEKISPRWEFFQEKNTHRILFVQSHTSKSKVKIFEKTSEVIVCPKKQQIAPFILKTLKTHGVRQLLIEGGGGVMWNFASLGLIDEYHVTLTPQILGGANAPTLVDGLGLKKNERLPLRLKNCEVKGDEIFLTYQARRR